MTDIHAHPAGVSPLEGAIERAAAGLADSITHALHDKPSKTLGCLVLWALSAPVLSLWNAI